MFAGTAPPIGSNGPLLGIDSQETYRQALTGLSWLSYSRPSISAQYPDLSKSGSRSYERAGSPRRLRLNGLLRAPNPLGGFVANGHAPTLSMTARGIAAASMSASPTLETLWSQRYRIERIGLLDCDTKAVGLLNGASVDLGEYLSIHPALQQEPVTDG